MRTIKKSMKNTKNMKNSTKNMKNSTKNMKYTKYLKKINCSFINSHLLKKSRKLGKGHTGIVFKGCIKNNCKYKIGVKFLLLNKKKEWSIKKKTHPSIIDARMGFQLSKLVERGITPHINVVYFNKICDIKSIKNQNSELQEWLDEIDLEKFHNKVNVIYNEIADIDLKKYILKNNVSYSDHLIILFSLCYSLACVQYYNKGFRHNDMHSSNILVKIDEEFSKYKDKYDLYIIFGLKFYIPCSRFTIKLHDFDYSNSDYFKNDKVHNYKTNALRKFGVSPKYNPAFDLHMFTNFTLKNKDLDNSIRQLYLNLIPKDTIGESNRHTNRFKLTNYFFNGKVNYVPPSMKTPAELLLFEKSIFKSFQDKKPSQIRHTYNSGILVNNELYRRGDMFNTKLVK